MASCQAFYCTNEVSSTLKSFEKRRSPLFGATGNFNHQILPYGILFLAFIITNVFYLLSFKEGEALRCKILKTTAQFGVGGRL
jgi:hypothetical protein